MLHGVGLKTGPRDRTECVGGATCIAFPDRFTTVDLVIGLGAEGFAIFLARFRAVIHLNGLRGRGVRRKVSASHEIVFECKVSPCSC